MFYFYVWKQECFWWLSWNGAYLDKDTSIWPGFEDSCCSKLHLVLCKRLTCRLLQSLSLKVCLYTFISCYLKKIIKMEFAELEKKFLQRFRSFFRKMIAEVLRFCRAKRFKDWTSLWYNSECLKLIGSKSASFHVCLHSFQCTPTRITVLVRKVSIGKIYWYGTVTFVYVSASVIQLMNTPFITFVLWYKTFPFLFQEWLLSKTETVTFYVLFAYKPTLCIVFCWMTMVRVSSQFNSLFILYISTTKPFSLVKADFISSQKPLAAS